jgi:hypothetical protein
MLISDFTIGRKFKECSTVQTTTSHLKPLNTKIRYYDSVGNPGPSLG